MHKNDFPIFENHDGLVYLDNAATSQKPASVINTLKRFYEYSNANVHRGIYELSEEATSLFEEARELIALYLNVSAKEIVFTSGATESVNMVAHGLQNKITHNSDDIILVTQMEHHSNLVPWQQISHKQHVQLEYVQVDNNFRLDLNQLEEILKTKQVKIFALTHMSNTLGTINPLKEISQLVRRVSPDTIIVVDGAQYAPHFKIDLNDLDVDFYAVAGHKMLGPTGIGVLYGKEKQLERMEPILTGGGMIRKVELYSTQWAPVPQKFEAGTPNIAGAVGLAEAVRYLKSLNYKELIDHEQELVDYFLANTSDIEGFKILGPKEGRDRGGVFSFVLEGAHPHDIAQMLDNHKIAVRAGHHCNQVLMREVLGVPATTRVSLYFYNDYKDIDKFTEAIKEVKTKLVRNISLTAT